MVRLSLTRAAVVVAALTSPALALAQDGPAPVTASRYGAWGVDLDGMDRSVRPGDDFFKFVNGTWDAKTTIPADRTSFGAIAILRDISEARVRGLIETWAKDTTLAAGSDEGKVGAIYRAFMDEAAIEALDAKPLEPTLSAVRAANTRAALATLMGRSFGDVGTSFFSLGVSDDARDPERYTLYLRQSGLGLPDREYYMGANFAKQKAAYQAYVAQMLGLVSWPDAEASAAAVVAMETRIAEAHWSRAQSRDRDRTYNPTTFAELASSAPAFPWNVFAKAAGVATAPKVVVAQQTAIPAIAAVFADTPVATLQAWQAFRLIDQSAPLLSARFVDAHWAFRIKTLQGAQEQRPRWKRGVDQAQGLMGEAVGRAYVAQYFPPESKAQMDTLVADLREALKRRIEALTWMEAPTKAAALEKLASFSVKIGYPNRWRDYSALKVSASDAFGNRRRWSAVEWARDVARIGQPVDKDEWGMTPQTVNAYYSSAKNEIAFPAGILQAPFFDPKADPAVNYGAIGGVIGHEITHGFDDQGRKSDARGVLRDWWTSGDAQRFEAQAEKFGAQYGAYEFPTLPGLHITPRLTMGENIADLGGVLLGLDAYRISLGGKPAPVLDGFTGPQRVFLGWAQAWRGKSRDDALRQQLVSDPHSPAVIRSFAPLRNVDAWYEAFDVKPGDKLYLAPEDRARIW